MWFFAIVYAVEGIGQARSGIMWQPLSHWLKETFHWTPVTISASIAIFDLPWVIKPVWGAISDFVPLFGYRRLPYLVLANIAGFLAFAWVATLDTATAVIPALTVTAFAMAISSTLCGALLVETGQKNNATGSFVNQQWLWFNIAQMITTLLAGYLHRDPLARRRPARRRRDRRDRPPRHHRRRLADPGTARPHRPGSPAQSA